MEGNVLAALSGDMQTVDEKGRDAERLLGRRQMSEQA